MKNSRAHLASEKNVRTTQAVIEVNKITLELEDLSRAFTANVLDATKAFGLTLTDKTEVEGLAAADLALAAQSAKVLPCPRCAPLECIARRVSRGVIG